jgi:hypothetical protein
MPLIQLLIILIIIGAGLYLVNQVLPIDPKIKTIINVVVIIAVLLWLLDLFGFGTGYVVGRHR